MCKGKKTLETKDSTGLYPTKKDCDTCRGQGEVMMMKESLARRLHPGSFSGLATDGFHPTAGIDHKTKLNVVIFPDKEFGNGQASNG